MKKFTLFLAIAMIIALVTPAAMAAPSNAEKNIGQFLCAPFRIIGTPLVAVGNLVQGKPAKMLTIPRDIRRESFDGVESFVRIPFAPAIEKDSGEMGAVNTGIADAGLDPVVDALVYGFAVGPAIFNNAAASSHHILTEQAWWGGVITGAGVAILDVGGAALEGNEK